MVQWFRALWDYLIPADGFHACLALGPAAIYFLMIGAINLSRRPFLVTGTRDAAALGLALSGFLLVGPIELFFPGALAVRFGPFVWLLMLAFYAMCLVLILLLLRPRLVIYNISVDQLRAVLAQLVDQLDTDARWAGDSLVLPGLGVQLHIDNLSLLRNVSLVATGPHQDYLGWRRLELALRAALSRVEVARNRRGAILVGVGVVVVLWLIAAIAHDPQAVAQALLDVLQLRQR